MADPKSKEPPEGYMTVARARQRLKVAPATMARIIRDSGIQTFDDPRDRRVKLLKVEDVEKLAQPRPSAADGGAQGKAAA